MHTRAFSALALSDDGRMCMIVGVSMCVDHVKEGHVRGLFSLCLEGLRAFVPLPFAS